jgi:hypothetical protein
MAGLLVPSWHAMPVNGCFLVSEAIGHVDHYTVSLVHFENRQRPLIIGTNHFAVSKAVGVCCYPSDISVKCVCHCLAAQNELESKKPSEGRDSLSCAAQN